MAWQVEYSPRAAKALRKLDKPVALRVFNLVERIARRQQGQSVTIAKWAETPRRFRTVGPFRDRHRHKPHQA